MVHKERTMVHQERGNGTLGEGQWYTRRGTMVHQERDNGTLGEGQWYARRGTLAG